MLKMLDPLREINFYSVAFRMILACICGGIKVKQYGNEICRARYGTVFWNS